MAADGKEASVFTMLVGKTAVNVRIAISDDSSGHSRMTAGKIFVEV
jgi:hypothetical protein